MFLKKLIVILSFCFLVVTLPAQEEGLPDFLTVLPNGREMPVKLLREDCNFIYYLMQKGGIENKLDWSRAAIRYGNESQLLTIAIDTFIGNNFASAKSNFEKVIADKSLSKWQIDYATYHIALCFLGLGELEKAKEKLLSIKNDSRWFYPSKLKVIDTLPEDKKIQAMKDLLRGTEVTGPFKIDLNFMLVDRFIADGNGKDAKLAFDDLKKAIPSPDKSTLVRFDEYQIKIDVMNKNYAEAEKKIKQYIASNTETGLMRIAMGDVLISKNQKEEALYEYLRGRLDFNDVDSEAGYKTGKLFYDIWLEDKIKNADYRKYAVKELNISRNAGDGVYSTMAKKMLDQLNK